MPDTPGSWPMPPSWSSWPAPSAASPSVWRRTRPAIPVPDTRSDRDFLAAKLEMADFGITQFFFEASEYEGLMADLEDRGVSTTRPAGNSARDLLEHHGTPRGHGRSRSRLDAGPPPIGP